MNIQVNTHLSRSRGELQAKKCRYRHCRKRFTTRNYRREYCITNHAHYEGAARRAEQARLFREGKN